jgi:hypothetical protein
LSKSIHLSQDIAAMSQLSRSGAPNLRVERSGTMIETDEEVRQANSGLKGQAELGRLPAAPSPAAERPHNNGPSASLFRPTARPHVAMLTVCDDGKLDGEVIRIRDHQFVIGRTEGDLKIPIDGRISSRNVEITLQTLGGPGRSGRVPCRQRPLSIRFAAATCSPSGRRDGRPRGLR